MENELSDFESSPSIGIAADLLRFGFHGKAAAPLRVPAQYLLESGDSIPTGLRRLAQAVLQGDVTGISLHGALDETKPISYEIHDLRRWLARFPRDSMSWLDLGRMHASMGNVKAATRAVQTAHDLAPQSRAVLRGTSRFFLHSHDPEKALYILEASARTASDPWLMAGHIAISSILGTTSKHLRRAKQIIAGKTMSPRETTELASALATLELENGSLRASKKLFNVALIDPNENALAQAEWAVSHLNMEPSLPLEWMETPATAEASYYRAMSRDDFQGALVDAVRWRRDEPFASRPMLGASFIAAILGRFEDASSFARQGLVTEPHSVPLLNNLIFSVAAAGDVTTAEHLLGKVYALENRSPGSHTLANFGMLAMLRGEYELSTRLYDKAILSFKKEGQLEEAALASIFRAFFARRGATDVQIHECIANAKAAVASLNSSLASTLLKVLLNDNEDSAPTAPLESKPRKWDYDPIQNVLTFEPLKPPD